MSREQSGWSGEYAQLNLFDLSEDTKFVLDIDCLINGTQDLNMKDNMFSIYEKGVIMSDSGANVVVIRDEELLNEKRITRMLKNIRIRGVRDGLFLCEAMGYLKSPFDKLIGMYVPTFKANIIGEVAARKAGYGILQENIKGFERDELNYLNDKGELIATFKRGKETLWCY